MQKLFDEQKKVASRISGISKKAVRNARKQAESRQGDTKYCRTIE